MRGRATVHHVHEAVKGRGVKRQEVLEFCRKKLLNALRASMERSA